MENKERARHILLTVEITTSLLAIALVIEYIINREQYMFGTEAGRWAYESETKYIGTLVLSAVTGGLAILVAWRRYLLVSAILWVASVLLYLI